jgi:predicted ferric reductase
VTETTDLLIWQFIRAAGLLSYVMLSLSVFMGIAVKTRFFDGLLKRAWVYEAHQSITMASLGLMALHLVLVLINRHVSFGLATALVPFLSSWRPLPTALGILAFYLAVALIGSSYVLRFIGYEAWRTLHYAGFLAWLAGLMHGVTAGSDTGLPAVELMYWLTAGAILFATVYRVLLPSPTRQQPTLTPSLKGGGS